MSGYCCNLCQQASQCIYLHYHSCMGNQSVILKALLRYNVCHTQASAV